MMVTMMTVIMMVMMNMKMMIMMIMMMIEGVRVLDMKRKCRVAKTRKM